MSLQTNHVTAEMLFARPDDGQRHELVRGELRMMSPAGGRHGRIALQVGALLYAHVGEYALGAAYGAETGFKIASNPDTVLAPDAAFISNDRLKSVMDDSGFISLAPDLAVEVVSPGDSPSEVRVKAQEWLSAGTRLVLIVDPKARTVHTCRPGRTDLLTEADVLDASDVVAGWTVLVRRLLA